MAHFPTLLLRASRRHFLRHPGQLALSLLGVALAVAVVVGIDAANSSAKRAFELSIEGVAGRATHLIDGGPEGLDEALYTRLRTVEGLRQSAPVVELWVRSPLLPGRSLQMLGLDPFAEPPLRGFTRELGVGGGGDLASFLTRPRTVALSGQLARDLDLAIGDSLPVEIAGQSLELAVIGLLEATSAAEGRTTRNMLWVDIATAQEIGNQPGRLTRIDLRLGEAEEQALRASLPPEARLSSTGSRSAGLTEMTRAFRLNLVALSLLALVVGAFLIYNTMSFSVVQRRQLIGLWRALGVSRRQVFALLLAEALLLGAVATACGLALGVVLASGLLQLVSRTINDLYFVVEVNQLDLPPLVLAKAVALGLGASVLAALAPAIEASRSSPRTVLQRSQLERSSRRALPWALAIGALLMLAAGGMLMLPSHSLPLSFAAVFVFLMGYACWVPAATYGGAWLAGWPLRRTLGLLGSLAARSVASSLSRTGVATAALVVAVATTLGVAVMVGSFRSTLVDWLDTTVRADVYISAISSGSRGQAAELEPEVVAAIAAVPGIDHLSTYSRLRLQGAAGPLQLVVIGMEERAFTSFDFAAGDSTTAWPAWQAGEAALVSEPFAFHQRLAVGDRVELPTDDGPRSFPIAGVIYDYASDRGLVYLHRDTYERHWRDRQVHSVALYTAADDTEQLIADLEQRVGSQQDLQILANRELRQTAVGIFDRTFAITRVLRLLALVVSFLGVLGALMAIELERGRELAVLRATGLTPRQLWGLVTTETGLLGLIAGVLSLPLGIALSVLLIEVINRRSFGWTLRMELAPELLWQSLALAIVAALLAGLIPAWRMSRASAARALRED